MTNKYIIVCAIIMLIATLTGSSVSGSVGALLGFFVVGLIAITGYLVILSVKGSDTERNS